MRRPSSPWPRNAASGGYSPSTATSSSTVCTAAPASRSSPASSLSDPDLTAQLAELADLAKAQPRRCRGGRSCSGNGSRARENARPDRGSKDNRAVFPSGNRTSHTQVVQVALGDRTSAVRVDAAVPARSVRTRACCAAIVPCRLARTGTGGPASRARRSSAAGRRESLWLCRAIGGVACIAAEEQGTLRPARDR